MIETKSDLNIKLGEMLPILDSISDAVFIDNAEGICLWCNSTCEDLYDILMEEIQGRTVDDLEQEGIFSPSVTKRVLAEQRELTIIHENKKARKPLYFLALRVIYHNIAYICIHCHIAFKITLFTNACC